MEVERPHNLQDERSDCRSLGSNYHPSSQSRKISIGITIDSEGIKRSGATKKDGIILSNSERPNYNKENTLEDKLKGKSVAEGIAGKQTEAPDKVTSPWITTRSLHQKPSTSETFVFGKQTSKLPSTKGRRNKLSRVQNTTITNSAKLFENQISILHSGDGQQKNFKGLTYKRKGSTDGKSQKVEEFTFATAQGVLVSDKRATENKREDERSETLKMKLWEILGTVSSPRSQPSNSQARKEGNNNLSVEKMHHQKGDAVLRAIQNSDTIETDSDNPDRTMKRPVTRSLTKNRVMSKVQRGKTKAGPSSSYRNKLHERNIFSFEEGLHGKGQVTASGGSSVSARKKGSGIKPRKILFGEKNADELQGRNFRSETPPAAEKASSHSDRRGNFHGCSPQSKDEYLKQKNKGQEGDSLQSPRNDSHHLAGENRVEKQGDVSSQEVPENEDKQEAFGQPSLKNFLDQQDEFESPTFKINTPRLSSSPSSAPKPDQIDQKVYSPGPKDRRFSLDKIHSFSTLKTSKADFCVPNAKTKSSDDEMEHKDSPPCKLSPLKGRKGPDDISESSSDYKDPMSSEEDHTEADAFSPETAKAERSKFMLHPSKRLHNLEGNIVNQFSPTLLSTKGINENDWNPEPSEQNQENELERVIALFALALENFKNKMKTATRKKSSDILLSVSEEIHIHLQNVASQIQNDVGELTSICKSKRKRLETRFQEQQEKLKLIQDKFKLDMHQHLEDCKSTVEELEMHHIELKGTMKKQKASHQKLVMKVEEAVEAQLNDAERRITAVHKSARQKMLQMQQVIGGCLNQGNDMFKASEMGRNPCLDGSLQAKLQLDVWDNGPYMESASSYNWA